MKATGPACVRRAIPARRLSGTAGLEINVLNMERRPSDGRDCRGPTDGRGTSTVRFDLLGQTGAIEARMGGADVAPGADRPADGIAAEAGRHPALSACLLHRPRHER